MSWLLFMSVPIKKGKKERRLLVFKFALLVHVQ